MNLQDEEKEVKKRKKLSLNQKNFRRYLKEKEELRKRVDDPKDIVDRHTDQIKTQIEKPLSRGQRKRLIKKIGAFSSKSHLTDKL